MLTDCWAAVKQTCLQAPRFSIIELPSKVSSTVNHVTFRFYITRYHMKLIKISLCRHSSCCTFSCYSRPFSRSISYDMSVVSAGKHSVLFSVISLILQTECMFYFLIYRSKGPSSIQTCLQIQQSIQTCLQVQQSTLQLSASIVLTN